MPTPQELAQSFLEHFNARSQPDLLKLVDRDVRYNGRHGDGEGIHLLQEWIERATTTMTPRRWFGDDEISVVEVDVEWRSPTSGDVTDRAVWAISFATSDDRISSISRFADVGEAVTKMGLIENDAIPEVELPESTET